MHGTLACVFTHFPLFFYLKQNYLIQDMRHVNNALKIFQKPFFAEDEGRISDYKFYFFGNNMVQRTRSIYS